MKIHITLENVPIGNKVSSLLSFIDYKVFGRKPLLWFLPIANGTADGIHYQKRAELEGLISA